MKLGEKGAMIGSNRMLARKMAPRRSLICNTSATSFRVHQNHIIQKTTLLLLKLHLHFLLRLLILLRVLRLLLRRHVVFLFTLSFASCDHVFPHFGSLRTVFAAFSYAGSIFVEQEGARETGQSEKAWDSCGPMNAEIVVHL